MLIDTGPLVALFDPRDAAHAHCRELLRSVREPLRTTAPVLTEAFHLLGPASRGSIALAEFVRRRGLAVWFLSEETLDRALELMSTYRDHPMDLADASLVAAAEVTSTTRVLTLDRSDFATYRVRIGRTSKRFTVLDPLAGRRRR